MGREITKRHALLYDRKIEKPFTFARDVYLHGKLRELFSFMVWEGLHRLKLFPEASYLKFNSEDVLSLENQKLSSSYFEQKLLARFAGSGLDVRKVEQNWKAVCIREDGEVFGCIYPNDQDLYRGREGSDAFTFVNRFPAQIKSIFISSRNTIFVCVKGALYRSSDDGETFEKSVDLGSHVSFFRHNNEITETPDGTLIMGEYGNIWENNSWRKLAYLYFSTDEGLTWERSGFLIDKGTNKHVHLVKYSKLFDRVYMADGDNYKKLWVSKSYRLADLLNPDQWQPITRFHIQMGGYTSVIEDEEKVLFGTDYQGGTNFLVQTRDGETFDKFVIPDPYRRSPIDNMVRRRTPSGSEIWANLPYSTPNSRCLLMYTADGGRTWNKIVDYQRSRHKTWLLSTAREDANVLYFSIENEKNGDRVVYRVADRQ